MIRFQITVNISLWLAVIGLYINYAVVCLCFHSSVNLWFVQYNKVSSVLQPLATHIIAPQPMKFLPGTSQPIRFLSSSARFNVKAFIHSFIHLLFNTNLSRKSYWPPFWRMHYYFIPYWPSIDLWRVYWIIIQFLSLQMKMDLWDNVAQSVYCWTVLTTSTVFVRHYSFAWTVPTIL